MNKNLKLIGRVAETYLMDKAGVEYVLLLKERIPNKLDQVYEIIMEARTAASQCGDKDAYKLFTLDI